LVFAGIAGFEYSWTTDGWFEHCTCPIKLFV
jgi:hypothetical protein